jgi:hypothetical protein
MAEARRQGWRVEQTGKSSRHLKWYSPDGKAVIVSSSTPSDHRAIKNHLALLRRAGFAR